MDERALETIWLSTRATRYLIKREKMLELELHQLVLKYAKLRIARPQAQARLMASLARAGQTTPVVAVPSSPESQAKNYILIDGYLRVAALGELKQDTVQIVVLSLSEQDALLWQKQQESNRRRSILEDAWLLQTLIETHGMSQADLARKLSRPKSWISRRLSLITILPDRVQALVRDGRLCAYAAGRYLVPLARANAESCERLAENLAKLELSTREIRRLYIAWKAGNPETKRRIEARPGLFSRAAKEVESIRPHQPETRRNGEMTHTMSAMSLTQELLIDLDELACSCDRLRKKLEKPPYDVPLPEPIRHAWARTWGAIETLARNLENHAGQ